MYYKNYWVNYHTLGNFIVVCEMHEDMTNFQNTEESHDFEKVKGFMFIKRSDYEDARNHLDKNGLFMGIIPPEEIEKDIENYNKRKEEQEKLLKEKVKEKYKNPWDESFFIYMKQSGCDFIHLIKELQVSNMMSKDYWGKDFPIDEYYMGYLLKYWHVSYSPEKGKMYGE